MGAYKNALIEFVENAIKQTTIYPTMTTEQQNEYFDLFQDQLLTHGYATAPVAIGDTKTLKTFWLHDLNNH